MQTQARDIRELCITRLKSDDFGFPLTRPHKPKLKLLGLLLLVLLTLAFILVGR